MSDFESQWSLLLWETQKAVGNRASTLKEHTQNFTHSETQGRSNNLKEARVRSICCSCKVSCRERKTTVHVADIDPGGSHYRELILSNGHVLHHLENSLQLISTWTQPHPPACWHQHWDTQAKQLVGQQHSPTYRRAGCLKTS